MTLHRAQAIFDNRSTGIPRDRVVNTFHFWCTKADPDEADGDELRTMLHDFYAAMPGVIVGLADEWRLKLVSIADPAPRLPWYDSPDSIEWAVGEALPAENALVLSFQQELVSGVPIARQRGRIFIGGLKTTVNSAGRVHHDRVVEVAQAASGLLAASDGSSLWKWHQHSATTGQHGPVTQGWVDNAFDTQRRRGVSATERWTWS